MSSPTVTAERLRDGVDRTLAQIDVGNRAIIFVRRSNGQLALGMAALDGHKIERVLGTTTISQKALVELKAAAEAILREPR